MKTHTQTQTDKATARPWHVAHNAEVTDTIHSGAGQVAQMSNGAMNNFGADVREANAALIVRAVNEHHALLAVAEAAKAAIDELSDGRGLSHMNGARLELTFKNLSAAITKHLSPA